MRDNAIHPQVEIVYGLDFLPERKDPSTLYLTGTVPGEPLNVACKLTPERFTVLQQVVREQNVRVFGYNAERRACLV
jgi:hypothetical protein